MPGTPKIEVEESEDKTVPWARSVDAEVDKDGGTLFGVSFVEFRGRVSIERMISAQRLAFQNLEVKSVTETRFTINGFPGAELASEEFGGWTVRVVVVQNRSFTLTAAARSDDPLVRRFLDSFKLLPVQQ
jgi:hypothetical protein